MKPHARPRLVRVAVLALVLGASGCRDEPNPQAIDVKSDPRIKRVEMNAPEPAIRK